MSTGMCSSEAYAPPLVSHKQDIGIALVQQAIVVHC